MEIETFEPIVTADDERRIGRLAIRARLLREEVYVWMEETGSNRQEDAPMWRVSARAWHILKDEINKLLDLEDA